MTGLDLTEGKERKGTNMWDLMMISKCSHLCQLFFFSSFFFFSFPFSIFHYGGVLMMHLLTTPLIKVPLVQLLLFSVSRCTYYYVTTSTCMITSSNKQRRHKPEVMPVFNLQFIIYLLCINER